MPERILEDRLSTYLDNTTSVRATLKLGKRSFRERFRDSLWALGIMVTIIGTAFYMGIAAVVDIFRRD